MPLVSWPLSGGHVLDVQPDLAEKCVQATCALHNFLPKTTTTPGATGVDGRGDTERLGLGTVGADNSGREAATVRETSDFSAEGAVQRQANL